MRRSNGLPYVIPCAFVVAAVISGRVDAEHTPADDAHAVYGELLAKYVSDEGAVRYDAWSAARADVLLLSAYVDALESTDPRSLDRSARLAYWLDLYNAATLELVLAHLPLESIRSIGGPDDSPWKRLIVAVGGDSLSLDHVENAIIRPEFDDARIHFALNCASIGCPPLARVPYSGSDVNERLDEATRFVVNDPRWVTVTQGGLALSKIFEWFEADFVNHSGSVGAFIAAYRADGDRLTEASGARSFLDYDWSLNRAR